MYACPIPRHEELTEFAEWTPGACLAEGSLMAAFPQHRRAIIVFLFAPMVYAMHLPAVSADFLFEALL